MKNSMFLILILSLFLACQPKEKEQQKITAIAPVASIAHQLRFENKIDSTYQLKGFQEVVFSVTDLEEATKLYKKVAGWEVAFSQTVSKAQLAAWQVADTAQAKETLLYNPGEKDGFLRLVQFANVPQRQIRSGAQTWDTGGIFDVNVRVKDIKESYRELQSNGWNAYHDPVLWKFGNFEVEQVLARGNDGVVLAMVQRHAPPLEGYTNLKKMSRVFNASQVVKDLDKTTDFYIKGLGFQIYMQDKNVTMEPVAHLLGVPYNLTDNFKSALCIVHPQGTNNGSIEIIQFAGLKGRDHSAFAVPPNLGILMHRFPVSNIEMFSKKIQERGISIKQPITKLEIEPYGTVKSLAVQTPDGAWLEFIELGE